MPRHVIVGDVHGMLDALRALLDAAALAPVDTLVLVGDIIDRGPDSAGTVRFLRELAARQPVVLVKGNHEVKFARWRRRCEHDPAGAGQLKSAEEFAPLAAALARAELAWLDGGALWLRIPEHGALVVHGGLPPLMPRLVGAERDGGAPPVLTGPADLGELPTAERPWAEQMLRLRWVRARTRVDLMLAATVELDPGAPAPEVDAEVHVTGRVMHRRLLPRGGFLALGEQQPGDPYWADLYDGRWGHVYFGHNPFTGQENPLEFPHATALDLGAVYGGRLAAAVLEPGCERRFVTVATG